jgi:hypothetical protein
VTLSQPHPASIPQLQSSISLSSILPQSSADFKKIIFDQIIECRLKTA